MITLAAGDTLRGKATNAAAVSYIASMLEIAAGEVYKNVQSQLGSTTTIQYTVPGSTQTQLSEIRFNETTGVDQVVSLFLNGTVLANRIVQFTIIANGSAAIFAGKIETYDATGKLLTTSALTVNSVDNTILADMAQATFKGRQAGAGTGDPQDMTAAQAKTALAIANTDVSGLGSLATASNLTGPITSTGAATAITNDAVDNTKLANMATATFKGRTTAATGDPEDLTTAQATALLDTATTTLKGLITAAANSFISGLNGAVMILVTANSYSNLKCDGATDDLAALNALYSGAPDGSTLVWPGQNATMVLSAAAVVPGGKHFIHVGGGPGNKTNVLATSLTADHFTCSDWYSTWTGFNFTTNNTTTTAVQTLSSGAVLTVAAVITALTPASGSITVGSAIGWQVLTYSARTSTTVTLSSTGTGSSIIGAPVVFKTAGAAINAGNFVGIDATSNTFSYVFNGYVCAGSTSNQSRIVGNGFLNTINFDIWIDGANWNGIIDSNTCDCTTNSRSVSHLEITQCGSVTGQGNQLIRGQYNMRLGSTTAAYPAGVFGVYFTNSFFDNAGIDAIKFQGISAIQRVKLTSCWLSSAVQKGLNFASTATTLPTDIDLIGCNIYSNGTDGIGGAGVQDYRLIGGEVAGNVTNGFNIAPATGGVYSVEAIGTRIGPTGGIGANGTGINVAAGTYTKIKFDHCDTTGNTTALTLGAVVVATASKFSITNCPGINPRGAVTPPIAAPVSTTVYTNTTGFRCHVIYKGATITATSINGVAMTTPGAALANQHVSVTLEPGATIALTGTTLVWAWAGM